LNALIVNDSLKIIESKAAIGEEIPKLNTDSEAKNLIIHISLSLVIA
jgi:hypothetical protein